MPKSFRRRRPTREPLPKILIACEGSKTELRYFEGIRQSMRLNTVKMILVKHQGTDIGSVIDAAIAERNALNRDDRWIVGDQAWAVVDEDGQSHHDNWHKALQRATQQDINLAIINPCFELWYLLHFQDHFAHITCDDVIKHLRRHISDYDKAGSYYPKPLAAKTTQAMQRAEILAGQIQRENLPEYTNPCCSRLPVLVKRLHDLNSTSES